MIPRPPYGFDSIEVAAGAAARDDLLLGHDKTTYRSPPVVTAS